MKNRSYTDEEVFKEGSTYSPHALKRRLIQYNLIPYSCQCCANTGSWNGKKLVLQLDHINGIRNDNRLENLRFVCPNCHSQTENYAGKNSTGMRSIDPLPNFRVVKQVKDIETWKQVKMILGDDIGKFGWKTKAAKLIGIRSQKVEKWIKRVDPSFIGS